jgi:hypothetical protein
MNDDEMREVYALWNKDEPNGHLAEITSHVSPNRTGRPGGDRSSKSSPGSNRKHATSNCLKFPVIAVGSTPVKVPATGHQPRVEFPSKSKPKEKL